MKENAIKTCVIVNMAIALMITNAYMKGELKIPSFSFPEISLPDISIRMPDIAISLSLPMTFGDNRKAEKREDVAYSGKRLENFQLKKPDPEPLDDNDIDDLIQAKAMAYGLDPNLIRLIASAESGFDGNAVSPKGAMGIMQLMPETAKQMGVKDPFDHSQNIDGGCKYMAFLMKRYDNNVKLSLAAYNAGHGAVDKYNGIPPYSETENYVKKIMKEYEKFNEHSPVKLFSGGYTFGINEKF